MIRRNLIKLALLAALFASSCGLPADALLLGGFSGGLGTSAPSGQALTANINGVNVPVMASARKLYNSGNVHWADITVDLTGFSLGAGATMAQPLRLVNSAGTVVKSRTIQNVDAVNGMPAGTFYTFGQPFADSDNVTGSFPLTTNRSTADFSSGHDLKVLLTNLVTTGTPAADMDGAGTWTASLNTGSVTWTEYGDTPGTSGLNMGRGQCGVRYGFYLPFVNGATTHRYLRLAGEGISYQKVDGTQGPIEIKSIWIENNLVYLKNNPSQFNYDASWQDSATVIRSFSAVQHCFMQTEFLMGTDGLGDWFGLANAPKLFFKHTLSETRATRTIPPYPSGITMPANCTLTVASINTSTDTITLANAGGVGVAAPFFCVGVELQSTGTLPGGVNPGQVYFASDLNTGNTRDLVLYVSAGDACAIGIYGTVTAAANQFNNQGTNYAVGEIVTFGNGLGPRGVAGTAQVTAISGGGGTGPITAMTVLTSGTYSLYAGPLVATSSTGAGTGAAVYFNNSRALSSVGRVDLTSAGSGTITVILSNGPGAAGLWYNDPDGGGNRPDIGIIAGWGADAIVANEVTFQRRARINALAMGAARVSARSTNNRPVSFLGQALSSTLWDGTDRTDTWWSLNTTNFYSAGIGPWTGAGGPLNNNINNGHWPNATYSVWLLEGGLHLQTLGLMNGNKTLASVNVASANGGRTPLMIGGGSVHYHSINFNDDQGRLSAWAARDLFFALMMSTAGSAEETYFTNLLVNNLNYVNDLLGLARPSSGNPQQGVPQNYLDMGYWSFSKFAEEDFSIWYLSAMMCMATALHGDNPAIATKLGAWVAAYLSNFVYNAYVSCPFNPTAYRVVPLSVYQSNSNWASTWDDVGFTAGSDTSCTFGASNIITLNANPWSNYTIVNGDKIMFLDFSPVNGSPGLPNPPVGVSKSVWYYIVNKSGLNFQVATSPGGSPLTFSPQGSTVIAMFHNETCPAAPAEAGVDQSPDGYMAQAQSCTAWMQAVGITNGAAAYALAAPRWTGSFANSPKFDYGNSY